jgi:hypothetical protein
MFTSVGRLEYSDNPYKLIVRVDPEIVRYYFEQVTKIGHIDLNRQRWPPHISVVRKEVPVNKSAWNKYQGSRITFNYDHYVYNDHVYYWLNAYSDQLEVIREELGLTCVSKFTQSPDGRRRFHITIGNLKN